LAIPVVRYPRVSQVNCPGLATDWTTEVLTKQMRAGGGMVSHNFSSSCRHQHDISTENMASDFENRFTASRDRSGSASDSL
jgi:cystathionine beta-lyase/cystathionine gamma-synthase